MMQIVVLTWILIGLFALIAVFGIIGAVMAIVAKKRKTAPEPEPEDNDVLPEKVVENVADLNDRFNRARYMSEDGK